MNWSRYMNWSRKLLCCIALAVTVSTVDAAVAHAYDTIDYGIDQAACQAAERQARAAGIRFADCFQTGPGHYSLALDD